MKVLALNHSPSFKKSEFKPTEAQIKTLDGDVQGLRGVLGDKKSFVNAVYERYSAPNKAHLDKNVMTEGAKKAYSSLSKKIKSFESGAALSEKAVALYKDTLKNKELEYKILGIEIADLKTNPQKHIEDNFEIARKKEVNSIYGDICSWRFDTMGEKIYKNV